ncbi:MAG: polyribonucleotide nucleotidyltransferase [Chloroflexi bacterium]|nr:polyribonucleotide nucleotidyltransferase [Chloroflexota bacterium]
MNTPVQFIGKYGGKELSLETGKIAGQAQGAVVARLGDTVVLATVCIAKEHNPAVDFLPLTVEYIEKMYAAGKIPGSFLRREGRPGDEAVLAGRIIDRPIRPLLPENWRREVQLITTVLATDQDNDPSILGAIASSAALAISPMPFDGPISAVRIGRVDSQYIINPTVEQRIQSEIDVFVVSTKKEVCMLESEAKEASEQIIFEAIKLGHKVNQEAIALQKTFTDAVGQAKYEIPASDKNQEAYALVKKQAENALKNALNEGNKVDFNATRDIIFDDVLKTASENFEKKDLAEAFEEITKEVVRHSAIYDKKRLSGRALDELRELSCEIALLPRVHGSSLFARGITQVLNVTTLGPINRAQQIDNLSNEETKRYMHQYNFLPYSTGEVKRVGSVGRREIGHGALAEKALLPVLPSQEEFPYTIRTVSECMSSSGSTSMASTCASSMSLMDAGVPIRKHVGGISIGLMTDKNNGNYVTLIDIEGLEDHFGDMDFKVTGTDSGITAIQLDIKLQGISMQVIERTLQQAKEARLVILAKMNEAIAVARPEVSPYAPKMIKINIDPDKIGAVIGSGGKTIRSITETTGATIDIDQDGTIYIGAIDGKSADMAIRMITDLTKEIEVGEIYTGKVVRIMPFGAFIELLPGKDGMVHVSELDSSRVEKVEDFIKVGDELTVKVIEIDSQGRVNLSRRVLLADYDPNEAKRPPRDRGSHPSSSGYHKR